MLNLILINIRSFTKKIMKVRKLSVIFISFLFVLFFIGLVNAHVGNLVSYNNIEIENDSVLFINSNDEKSYFASANISEVREEILKTIIVKNNGYLCPLTYFRGNNESNSSYFMAKCDKKIKNLEISDSFFKDGYLDKVYNVHYGNETETFIDNNIIVFNLTITDDVQEINGESKYSIFLKYLVMGIEHIWTGPDHILFILGYILLSITFVGLLKGITGFTVSHSATLTLAALGILTISPSIVEPLIALSIAVVGILSLLDIGKSWFLRFGIIFSFGLFHGLGFAGSIAKVGFPKEGFVSALLGFNIGIELGQIVIVLITFPILIYLDKKHRKIGKITRKSLGGIVVIAGIFWFIQRVFF